MINSRDELIKRAKQFNSQEEQIDFIMNYFLKHAKYNYAYLFAKGYAEGNISQVNGKFGLSVNKTRLEGDADFSITQSPTIGESKIHDDILAIRDKNCDDYDMFILELRNYITDIMSSHIDNTDIVAKSVDAIMKQIEKGLRAKRIVRFNDKDIECNNDISKVLIDFILKPRAFFPPEYENGIIKKGVCQDYTNYLMDLFKELEIEAHSVRGTGEIDHAWIIVKENNQLKSIDLTRAIYIRDGFIGIPKEQTSQDWLYTDLDKMFAMQKTRRIDEIDGRKLDTIIDIHNYDEKSLLELLTGQDNSEFGISSVVKDILGNGITSLDIKSVADMEMHIENEI